MIKLLLAALTGIFFLASTPEAQARHKSQPSFNCGYASNATERAVCSSRHLARLDRNLAYWYRRAGIRASYFDMTTWLRTEQRNWLQERNSCGSYRGCIARKYRQRTRTLRNWATHV